MGTITTRLGYLVDERFLPGIPPVLAVSATTVSTNANTTETDLFSYTIPGGLLPTTRDVLIRATLHFSTAANAHDKTFTVYFGSLSIPLALGAANDYAGLITLEMVCRGSSQKGSVTLQMRTATAGTSPIFYTSTTNDLTDDSTQDIIVKVTATNGTAAANDCQGHRWLVECMDTSV